MNLPGRLRATTLGDVLGTLYRARASGVLELVEQAGFTAGSTHRVVLADGLVSQVETSVPIARLGEILQRKGFISSGDARQMLRRLAEAPLKRAGEVLVEDRLVSNEVIFAALRHQVKTRLDALFRIREARVHFRVPRPRAAEDAPLIPLSPKEFLHGRPRARDRRSDRPPLQTDFSAPEPPRRKDPVRTRALEVLGLEPDADAKAAQRAFRRLAATLHPDRYPRASTKERVQLMRRFAELSAAYHSLVA